MYFVAAPLRYLSFSDKEGRKFAKWCYFLGSERKPIPGWCNSLGCCDFKNLTIPMVEHFNRSNTSFKNISISLEPLWTCRASKLKISFYFIKSAKVY
jgi:hypothetical protein